MNRSNGKHTINSISKAFTVMLIGCALTFGVAVTIAVIIAKISFNLAFNSDDAGESSVSSDLVEIRSSLK